MNIADRPSEGPDLSAAAMPDKDRRKKLRVLVLAAVGLITFAGAAVASRAHDPLGGERPSASAIAQVPRAQMAYEAFVAKRKRPPTSWELAKAIAKDGGPKVDVVGPGKKRPHALRLGGTKEAPALELLDERGNVATYGDLPVIIQVRVP